LTVLLCYVDAPLKMILWDRNMLGECWSDKYIGHTWLNTFHFQTFFLLLFVIVIYYTFTVEIQPFLEYMLSLDILIHLGSITNTTREPGANAASPFSIVNSEGYRGKKLLIALNWYCYTLSFVPLDSLHFLSVGKVSNCKQLQYLVAFYKHAACNTE
jgi:hypothetical protein